MLDALAAKHTRDRARLLLLLYGNTCEQHRERMVQVGGSRARAGCRMEALLQQAAVLGDPRCACITLRFPPVSLGIRKPWLRHPSGNGHISSRLMGVFCRRCCCPCLDRTWQRTSCCCRSCSPCTWQAAARLPPQRAAGWQPPGQARGVWRLCCPTCRCVRRSDEITTTACAWHVVHIGARS